jgi:tRNA threonylcarbamoyladenosine biosynthesis protein TsaE
MPIATNSEKIDISSEVKTAELAKNFTKILEKGDVVFLYGEIGVGKTTFIKHLINALQKKNNLQLTEITSPTFNIVNEYDIGNLNIKHYDLFRLTDNKELENIGLLENYNEHITLIEWPEKVKMVIDNKVSLFFEYGHDLEKRTINIKGLSEKKLNDIK